MSPTGERWQHKIVLASKYMHSMKKVDLLDACGNEGWELISAVPPGGTGDEIEYVFRRRVVSNTPYRG